METTRLSDKDIREIELFKKGFPWMEICAPATRERGVKVLDELKVEHSVKTTDDYLTGMSDEKLVFAKFVPASGAASRMFKDLFNKNVSITNKFVSHIEKFAFYDESLYAGLKGDELVDFTLLESGLNYGSKPKGVLKFHRYPTEVRTAVAEHLVEAASYVADSDGVAHLVITISEEHRKLFEDAIEQVRETYEKRYGVKYDIKLVYQQKWTDTIAVTPGNEPFLKEDGSVLHRPAGHGALIHTLNEVDADVVCIKNIDNVSVESNLALTSKWKRVLIGTALSYRKRIFDYIDRLQATPSQSLCDEVIAFLKDELCIEFANQPSADKLMQVLNRPIRVCGVVRNEGEPGGGPFIIREADGSTSLQILEGAQINADDPVAVECLRNATHFNPVDLVCVITDRNGNHFELKDFVDDNAGFISSKSYQGRELKALELPGLWNGAMSRWNTVFVEVPVETFNPVKTVMDLLRPAHQGI